METYRQIKEQNYLIIPLDAAKAFDKIQYHFLIKVMEMLGMNAAYINIIQILYIKFIDNIILEKKTTMSLV